MSKYSFETRGKFHSSPIDKYSNESEILAHIRVKKYFNFYLCFKI